MFRMAIMSVLRLGFDGSRGGRFGLSGTVTVGGGEEGGRALNAEETVISVPGIGNRS